MADIDKLAEEIASLTLLEASQLKDKLEEMLGVEAASGGGMMMMGGGMPMAGGAAGGAAAEEEEAPTEFDVMLTDVGPKKINVIKAVRALTSLGLKEAKEVVEGAPSKIMEAVGKEVADDAKAKLEEAGAKAEVKGA
jgi:large subunit ribosomal protein L7/L12